MLVENGISLDLSDGLVEAPSDLLSFFHDRLKVMLRDQGARHDLVDAVISEKSADMLVITRRVEALSAFLGSDAGANLLAGYRRAANILAAEEKKDGKTYDGSIDTASLPSDESHALASAVIVCEEAVAAAIAEGDFADALDQLAGLREPVDAFFDKVLVNDPDPALRAGRLNILARLRNTMHLIADFSKVAG
jgi:glycyl-tRNA synthetase beta chain